VLAQHIPLLNYALLPSPLQLPGGSAAPFFSGVAIPLADSRLYSFLATVKLHTKLNTVLFAGAFSPQTASNRPWIYDGVTPLFLQNCVVRLCPWQSPSILRLSPCASTTRLGKDTAAFIDLHDYRHLVVECCAKATTSDDNWSDPTAWYLPKRQHVSESFPKAIFVYFPSAHHFACHFTVWAVTFCLNSFHVTVILSSLVWENQDFFFWIYDKSCSTWFCVCSYKHTILQRNPCRYCRKVKQISKSCC